MSNQSLKCFRGELTGVLSCSQKCGPNYPPQSTKEDSDLSTMLVADAPAPETANEGTEVVDGHKATILGRICDDTILTDVGDPDGIRGAEHTLPRR